MLQPGPWLRERPECSGLDYLRKLEGEEPRDSGESFLILQAMVALAGGREAASLLGRVVGTQC